MVRSTWYTTVLSSTVFFEILEPFKKDTIYKISDILFLMTVNNLSLRMCYNDEIGAMRNKCQV